MPYQSNTNQIPIIYNLFCRNFLLLTKSVIFLYFVSSNKLYSIFIY